VCEKDIYPTLGLVALNIGGPIGVYLFGVLNDRYGRRFSYFSCLATLLFGSFITSASTNFTMWAFSRIIVGLTIPAVYQIPFIIGKKWSSSPFPSDQKEKGEKQEGKILCTMCLSHQKKKFSHFMLFNFSIGTCWAKLSFFCDRYDLYILLVGTNGTGIGYNLST
jgi:quinol-cytochrome oxidoreductase complex cytochrome b subunit